MHRLDNGLLLSCAYDQKVICWHYNEDCKYGEIVKEGHQLRCINVVNESGNLLIGTNGHIVLSQSITDWVNFDGYDDVQGTTFQDEENYGEEDKSEEEEEKQDYGDELLEG